MRSLYPYPYVQRHSNPSGFLVKEEGRNGAYLKVFYIGVIFFCAYVIVGFLEENVKIPQKGKRVPVGFEIAN